MSLRLLEVTLPGADLAAVPDVLRDAPVVHTWMSGGRDGPGIVRVLLEAEEAEAVSDRFVTRFGAADAFRLVLLAVEATLPAVERDADAQDRDEGSDADRAGPRRISREELYEDVSQAGRLTPVYVVMVALSTVVAAVGLLRGDLAIVIGAMVIAPLLGPNVALSLAWTLGDLELARRSLRAIGAGIGTALAASMTLGLVLPVDPSAPEIAARTGPQIADIFLALAAGAAGSLAFTSGVPAVLVGVMVAVALLPPLVAAGLLAGAGYGRAAFGAAVLTMTNVTCINLAAVATFLIQKVRPRTWWEEDRAKKATRVAVVTWLLLLAALVGLIVLGRVEPL